MSVIIIIFIYPRQLPLTHLPVRVAYYLTTITVCIGGGGMYSNAPMSGIPVSYSRVKPSPRWSKASERGFEPMSMAGLLLRSAIVSNCESP